MGRPRKVAAPEALTAEDLKALAYLPRVVVALRKLAAQAATIQNLSTAFNITATPAGGTAPVDPPRNGSEAGRTLAPAFRPPRKVPGVDERLPDFTPQQPPSQARLRLNAKLEEIRTDPEREAMLSQFSGGGEAPAPIPEAPDEDFM